MLNVSVLEDLIQGWTIQGVRNELSSLGLEHVVGHVQTLRSHSVVFFPAVPKVKEIEVDGVQAVRTWPLGYGKAKSKLDAHAREPTVEMDDSESLANGSRKINNVDADSPRMPPSPS